MTGGRMQQKLRLARQRWGIEQMSPIAETATSQVFKVERPAGPAVLKILKPYGADEIHGAVLMTWYDGVGAARIYDIHDEMILMEWLDRAPLGDLVRNGGDAEATEILCEVMGALHRPRTDIHDQFATLTTWFDTLFMADPAWWPVSHRPYFARATSIARELLETTNAVIPLHGDFHHDNVIGSSRGWLAIDPKGLLGDPAYEVANVFRNPFGANDVIVRRERIEHLARRFAAALGCEPGRVLRWAVAHSAISACWDRAAGNRIDWDLTMLPKLIAVLDGMSSD
jgi:streptomycin 6-kinase